MEIEVYQSDPFTAKKEDLLARFSSEYRFQKGDELYIEQDRGRPLKVRVIDVRVYVQPAGTARCEVLALKL